MAILEDVKARLRVSNNSYDAEITSLIKAAEIDLGIAGVELPDEIDDNVLTAIVAYCKVMFGNMDPSDADRWKRIYDEAKAQMVTATGYTDWGESCV